MKKLLSLLLAVLMLVSAFSLTAVAAPSDSSDDSAAVETENATGSNVSTEYIKVTYEDYLSKYADAKPGTEEIVITADNLTAKTSGVKVNKGDYDGVKNTIFTGEDDEVTFTFKVKEAGLYTLYLDYHTEDGKNISVERALSINGEVPFSNANYFNFTRVWQDVTNEEVDYSVVGPNSNIDRDKYFREDAYGNDIRPEQKESFQWTGSYFYDYLGYYSDPLEFYFKEGKNTITLTSSKEPVTIGSITLKPADSVLSYDEYVKAHGDKSNSDAEVIRIDAEMPTYKSDQTLYAYSDTSSPATTPYEGYVMHINTIGNTQWKYAQQSITYTFTTEKAGWYYITFKSRKNTNRGMISSRKLYIDDEVPFTECSAIPFKFSNEWVYTSATYTDAEGNDQQCRYWLDKGEHTLKLETTQGATGEYLQRAQDALAEINAIYRKIVIITGTSPDKYRDYKLEKLIPDVIDNMKVQADILDEIVEGIVELTGTKGSDLATLESMSRQLIDMYENPEEIGKLLSFFKTTIGTMGTWLNTASDIPLDLDSIYVSGCASEELEPVKQGFFKSVAFDINQFIASFIIDYNSIGNMEKTTEGDKTVTVWVVTGRDQFQTLRNLINNTYPKFLKENKLDEEQRVDLQLVGGGALLSAVVAGIGPDVALGQGQGDPVNYALRGAVADLTKLTSPEELKEVTSRFSETSLVPYWFDNGESVGLYALPEAQSFNVMFYRTDVLGELGIKVPETWTELITAIQELNKNNLEFAMPVDITMYFSLLMQNGGTVYNENGSATVLNTDEAVTSFKQWTNYYVNYGLPLSFDFQNRFRTGEMPLGISNYTLYNTLAVAAPEIKGLWDFTLIPGTVQEDGSISNANYLSSSCVLILENSEKKEYAWNFLNWWTQADIQSQYGTLMEGILGPSARYNTANVEAFEALPWSTHEIDVLNAQLEQSESIPEYAGSYFLGRHITNAFRKVVYKAADPKDTLLDYNNTINSEITTKREEFGLPTVND